MVPQPQPPCFQGLIHRILVLLILAWLTAVSALAQTGPRILHQDLKCVLSGQHLILEALIEPADGLTTVKAYFRADLYSQFYYIEMVRTGDAYQGVLPKPSPEIGGLHYYLEAMDSSFNSVRTAEYTPQVVSNETDCRERNPTPATYLDGTGAITVGSTGGGSVFPPGFLTEGIAGAIPAIGRSASGGSGLLIGGAAAAGAAVGVGVLVSGGDDSASTTTTISTGVGATTSAPTTSVPGGTTTAPPSTGVMACFETSPNPPRIPVGGSIRFDASCTEPPREEIRTYVWNFNDGRGERDGRVVNRVYNQPGTYGAVLTVTSLSGEQDIFETDVIVEEGPAPPGGGGTPGPPSTADVQLLTSGTLGAVVTHTFTIRNNGPLDAIDVTFSTTISGAYTGYSGALTAGFSSCTFTPPTVNCTAATMAPGASFTVTVTVIPTSPTTITSTATTGSASPPDTVANNNRTITTPAPLLAPPNSPGRVIMRLTSHLELPPADGSTQAQVIFNESRTAMTDNSGPSTHEAPGLSGENIVEGQTTSNPRAEGVWRFDFRGAPGFVPGSFVIESGQVVSRQSHEIVLRVAPGIRRVRFRYRLE